MTNALANNLLATEAGVGRWVLDARASSVGITHKIMAGMVTVKGAFTGLSGEGTIAAGGRLSGTLRIDAASIDTKNKKRDVHLRSADFFDVEKFPDITAVITSAAVVGEDVRLQAELCVKGVREPLPLVARVSDASQAAVTVTVEVKIDRNRFGLSWNQFGMLRGLTTVTATAVFHRVV